MIKRQKKKHGNTLSQTRRHLLFSVALISIVFNVNAQWVSGPANSLYWANGKVGIGNINPNYRLEVFETTQLGTVAGNSTAITGFGALVGGNGMTNKIYVVRSLNGNDWSSARMHDAIAVDASFHTPWVDTKTWWERDPWYNIQSWGNANQTYMTLKNGALGIGEANPTEKLHVRGGRILASNATFAGINLSLDAASVPVIRFTRYTGGANTHHNAFAGQVWNPSLQEYCYGIGTGLATDGNQETGTTKVVVTLNGSVGIGTEAPASRFHIVDGGFRHGGTGEINVDAPGVIGGRLKILDNGNVGINTASPDDKLTVKGRIHTQEVRVDLAGAVTPDYVFEKDYNLMSLSEVEAYLNSYKHLPEVPSAKEMETDGMNLKEMNLILLKKVEELTLHVIELEKKNARLTDELSVVDTLKKEIALIHSMLKQK